MISMSLLVFTLFDLFDGSAKEYFRENLRISVIMGVLTSPLLVFFTKFFTNPKR